jgi:hypothetical protein
MLDVVIVLGGGQFRHEILVGGELCYNRGNVGIAGQLADLVGNILVTKYFIKDTHNFKGLNYDNKGSVFSRNKKKKIGNNLFLTNKVGQKSRWFAENEYLCILDTTRIIPANCC